MPEYKMSSIGSSYAQKSARSNLLIAITSGSYIQFTGTTPVIPESVVARSVFDEYTTDSTSFSAGQLFRDLGRVMVVVDDSVVGSPHRRVFREVAVLNGQTNEGLNGDVNAFVQVYSAYGGGGNLDLARLG
jgi:hypothetical protein